MNILQKRRLLSRSTHTVVCCILFLAGGSLMSPAAHAKSKPRRAVSGAVGLLLPDKSNSRWLQDAKYFVKRLGHRVPHATWVVLNAHGSEATQIDQAKTAIASGAKVLVVAPVDQSAARPILVKAAQKHVAVIAYDRPIKAPGVAMYVGFDAVAVGKIQGAFIAKHVPKSGRLVFINGPADDELASGQYQGYFSDLLGPAIKKRRFINEGAYWTTSWSSGQARASTIDALFRNKDRVQGVVAADDSLAAGVLAALKQVHFTSKVWLTGSDATVSGLRDLIRGTQSMTVYKPVYLEARAAADAAASILLNSGTPKAFRKKYDAGYGPVKAALFQPKLVTPTKIKQTVIKDKFVTRKAICSGLTKRCKKLHI